MITKTLLPLLLATSLASCTGQSLVGKFKDLQAKGEAKAAPALAEVVDYRCTFMTEVDRAKLLAGVNGELALRGSVARAAPLDCDGDGAPDRLE